MNQKIKTLSILTITLFFFACHSGSKKQEENNTQTKKEALAPAPSFDADSAFHYVQKQVNFGPRIPNTAAHKKCAAWLSATMRKFADSTTIQRTEVSTHGQRYSCINIIGHFNPKSKERILLLAHWDTRAFADGEAKTKGQHFDGADDGGSGIAALLEIARQLQIKKQPLGVDILLTDVEDAGVENDPKSWGLGTQHWSKKAKQDGYKAKYGILLDMVGGKGAHFYREIITRHYAESQSKMVWDIANKIGYSDYFRYRILQNVGITDDHEFVNKITGIPTMDIIGLQGNGDFMPWHHKLSDNMDIIDKNTLKAVGQTVLQVIYANLNY